MSNIAIHEFYFLCLLVWMRKQHAVKFCPAIFFAVNFYTTKNLCRGQAPPKRSRGKISGGKKSPWQKFRAAKNPHCRKYPEAKRSGGEVSSREIFAACEKSPQKKVQEAKSLETKYRAEKSR